MRNREEKNICCICGDQKDDFDVITFDQGKKICTTCGRKLNMIFDGEKWDNTGEIKKSDEERSFFSNDFMGSGENKENRRRRLYPKEIKRQLDRYVVGQEQAKELLAVASYNHYKRINLNDPDIQKSNILLMGQTGCGKTHLVRTLARILDVPVTIVPATRLTEAGYFGDDVESCIQSLLMEAGNDVEKAESGIVFIDEIDKLTSSSTETQRVVGGKGVQQALLPLIEGCKVEITTTPKSVGVATFTNSTKIVNTSNILFICGGAFPDLEEIIKERLGEKNKNIGFLKDSEDSEDVCENPLKYVETQDLEKFGLIPELLGRLPVKAVLDSLTTDVLKRILVEPQGSLVSQYRKLFAFDGIDLLFEDEALDYIAQLAYKEKTGARSLRTIMEKYLNRLMYESPGNTNIKTLTISKEFLLNQQNLLIKKHAFG